MKKIMVLAAFITSALAVNAAEPIPNPPSAPPVRVFHRVKPADAPPVMPNKLRRTNNPANPWRWTQGYGWWRWDGTEPVKTKAPCSPQCTCGCNETGDCNCNKATKPAGQQPGENEWWGYDPRHGDRTLNLAPPVQFGTPIRQGPAYSPPSTPAACSS